ncbi:ADAMTS-like protein 2 [Glandiceps talaboti]
MERRSFLRVCLIHLSLYCLWTNQAAGQFGEEWITSKETSDIEKTNTEYYWSTWSVWKECSRPCDIGASFRERTCLQTGSMYISVHNDLCGGQDREYRACNIHPCPPGLFGDFRAMQCSSFDTELFYLGRQHHWKPYYTRKEANSNPCALVCYSEEEPSLVTQLSQVLDGTPCEMKHQKAICVAGKCQPIGCDGKLYSNLRLDHCGVCGGDRKACKTIRGTFKQSNITKGYTEVVRIPKGATHIRIVEKTRYDDVYLALRSGLDERLFINGYRMINPPTKYEIAGTTLDYVRPTERRNDTQENMVAPGPTDQPLMLMVLSMAPHNVQNLHISYQYAISETQIKIEERPTLAGLLQYAPKPSHGELKEVIADRYDEAEMTQDEEDYDDNSEDSFFEIDVQSTLVPTPDIMALSSTRRGYRNRNNDKTNQDDRSNLRAKFNESDIDKKYLPAHTYYWVANVAPCSATCSSGLSVTYARCFRNTGESARESDCDPATRPEPRLERTCGGKPCEARWMASKWSRCSVTCGQGLQYRAVRCWRMMAEGLDSSVANSQCDSGEKPETTRQCQSPECGALWQTSDWGQCSRKCGGGYRTREVRCSVPGSTSCKREDKPNYRQRCNEVPCQTQWAVSPWSQCTEPCTIISRALYCVDLKGDSMELDACDPSKEIPHTVELCGDNCDPTWVPHDWDACTSNCGIKRRNIVCAGLRNGKVKNFNNSACDVVTKPDETADCREGPCEDQPKWFSTEWSQCSTSCGKGVRTREVTCYLNNVPTRGCSENAKPITEEQCDTPSCSNEAPAEDCQNDPTANCKLAVQLALCKHWYYKRACCHSCKGQSPDRR